MDVVKKELEETLKIQVSNSMSAGSSNRPWVMNLLQQLKPPFRKNKEKFQPISIFVPALQVDELMEITDNFGRNSLIADGKFRRVYVGVLRSDQTAAIKKLVCFSAITRGDDVTISESDWTNQPDPDFIAQVSMVSRLKHDNLVKLLGYCVDGGLRVLAYEYAPNGTLHDILFGRKSWLTRLGIAVHRSQPGPVLSWSQRVKIAVGAAKGLEYLHKKAHPRIIHHGISSSNILLFEDYVAKISDFDIYEHPPEVCASFHAVEIHRSTYYAPEIAITGKHTSKSDVFSFGVLLLLLLTGGTGFTEGGLLVRAKAILSERTYEQFVDPRLDGQYPPKAVAKMAEVADLCVRDEAHSRPNMSIVVKNLQPLLDARFGPPN